MEYTVIARLEDRTESRERVRASQVPLVVEDYKRMGAVVRVQIDGTDVLVVESLDADR